MSLNLVDNFRSLTNYNLSVINMDSNSPLRFLNIDVSYYLYETYFPSDSSREHKKNLNKQFSKKIDEYLKKYKVSTIYENEIMYCVRGSLYKRITFFSFINQPKYYRFKKNHPLILKGHPLSYFRANKYKNETLFKKKLINYIV